MPSICWGGRDEFERNVEPISRIVGCVLQLLGCYIAFTNVLGKLPMDILQVTNMSLLPYIVKG